MSKMEASDDNGELQASTVLSLLFGACTYLTMTAAKVGRFGYLPLQGEWQWNAPAHTLPMDWYFRAFLTIIACLVGALVGRSQLASKLTQSRKQQLLWLGLLVLTWAMLFTSLVLVQSPRSWQNTHSQRNSR